MHVDPLSHQSLRCSEWSASLWSTKEDEALRRLGHLHWAGHSLETLFNVFNALNDFNIVLFDWQCFHSFGYIIYPVV